MEWDMGVGSDVRAFGFVVYDTRFVLRDGFVSYSAGKFGKMSLQGTYYWKDGVSGSLVLLVSLSFASTMEVGGRHIGAVGAIGRCVGRVEVLLIQIRHM